MNNNIPAAGILVTITKFEPLGIDKGLLVTSSDAKMKLVGNANGWVTNPAPNSFRVDTGRIVDLVFMVEAGDSDPYTYQPIGMSFYAKTGDDLGMNDFPLRTLAAGPFNKMTLTVRDLSVTRGSFKFALVVQRSDGALGFIDPQVSNG